MKVLVIHNEYGRVSGEEISLYGLVGLFRDHGHEVSTYSAEQRRNPLHAARQTAGFLERDLQSGGLQGHCTLAPRLAARRRSGEEPFPSDLARHTPEIIRRARVPIVMSVPNYRLMCPNGLHVSHGQLCPTPPGRRVLGAGCGFANPVCPRASAMPLAQPGWRGNSAGSRTMSRPTFVRQRFLCDRLIAAGFDRTRIHILPNLVADPLAGNADHDPSPGDFVGYAGRMRLEGRAPCCRRPALCPQIAFQLAGRVREGFSLPRPLPANVTLLGHLGGGSPGGSSYRGARMIVTPGECFETFGMSTAEGPLAPPAGDCLADRRLAGIRSRRGGRAALRAQGNAAELADRIRYLWDRPELCRPMGRAGRELRPGRVFAPAGVSGPDGGFRAGPRDAPVGGR